MPVSELLVGGVLLGGVAAQPSRERGDTRGRAQGVFGDLLGIDDAEIAALRDSGVIWFKNYPM